MATGRLPVEQLRDYLQQLPPKARALLIAELERATLRGDDIPGGEALLAEVRNAVRETHARAERVGDPARLFFSGVEPFLIDDDGGSKLLGRIARPSLDALWRWICRDLAPDAATKFCDEAARALVAGDTAATDHLARSFRDQVAARIQAALAIGKNDEKAQRRMAGQIGTATALDDAQDLATILSSCDALTLFESRLPGQIRNLTDSQLESIKGLLDSPICPQRELLPYALVAVMGRLAAPWQLIRLAVKAVDSDGVARVAASPFAVAVTITLADVERMVVVLKANLHRGAADSAMTWIKAIHDAARGLRTELDLAGDTAWGRQLSAVRSEVSAILKTEIESMPGRVRRLLRPRPSNEIARGAVLDSGDVLETEALIELVGACRNYASELAISEMTLRTFQELQHYLDTGTRALLHGLRHAGEADRPFRQSQLDAAVRFCAKVFGQDYAALLTKAAEVAASERKAAAKV